ncbi:hypothetical protein [Anabaena lutea]|uniref:Uncharacterized protein n=1 Tax=Anabaena lutea FACHB-196 TaxID=2692881 RepID=A0ABR8FF10_9NOST|nr:hypothetical protein [Anabaena lutea]MBD2568364.1 hypothetical protein [Anabaena lutea FACHB-196]
MTNNLPENPGSFEHLQSVTRQQFNKQVALYFKDLGDSWIPNVATPRDRLRSACTMTDEDNELCMAARHRLFYDILGYGRSNLAVIFGSHDKYDPPVEGHPIVYLYFSQDAESVPKGLTKVDACYSFRLMNETQSSITPAKALSLATEIKSLFIQGNNGIRITKGKNQYIYFHKEKGYRLRIYSNSEGDAVDIIKRMLQLTNTPYDVDRLSENKPKRPNYKKSEKQLVYGKQRLIKRYRPTANVFFRYSYMEIPGSPQPLMLVDTTYRHGGLILL